MENKKYFFGWNNFKWLIKEVVNIYSSKKSFFSKKRIESGIAFVIGQWGMILFFTDHYKTMSTGDNLLWAGAEFAISGYLINQIQKEKKDDVIENNQGGN
jgi:hypothetical protein